MSMSGGSFRSRKFFSDPTAAFTILRSIHCPFTGCQVCPVKRETVSPDFSSPCCGASGAVLKRYLAGVCSLNIYFTLVQTQGYFYDEPDAYSSVAVDAA